MSPGSPLYQYGGVGTVQYRGIVTTVQQWVDWLRSCLGAPMTVCVILDTLLHPFILQFTLM